MTDVTTTDEFPLSRKMAKQILREIVAHRSQNLRFSRHARERMAEREVTTRQVIQLINSTSNRFTEDPHQTAAGSWKFKLTAYVSGREVHAVFDLKRCETDPKTIVVTVIA